MYQSSRRKYIAVPQACEGKTAKASMGHYKTRVIGEEEGQKEKAE